MAFYKEDSGGLLFAPTFVVGPGVELYAENHTNYTYPVNGWYWYNSLEEALLANNMTAGKGSTSITKLAFRKRFTKNERIAIQQAMYDIPSNDTNQLKKDRAELRVYENDILSMESVNLTGNSIQNIVTEYELRGLIGVGRGSIILNTPISIGERAD